MKTGRKNRYVIEDSLVKYEGKLANGQLGRNRSGEGSSTGEQRIKGSTQSNAGQGYAGCERGSGEQGLPVRTFSERSAEANARAGRNALGKNPERVPNGWRYDIRGARQGLRGDDTVKAYKHLTRKNRKIFGHFSIR